MAPICDHTDKRIFCRVSYSFFHILGDIEALHNNVVIYDTAGLPSCDSNAICMVPDVNFFPNFSLFDLVSELNFDRKFKSGRCTQLFGLQAYNYGPVLHLPTPFNRSVNPIVCDMFDFVSTNFPDLNFNSCLINFYRNNRCFIPDHSDDESEIVHSSFILTLSLGNEKKMIFKDKITARPLCSVHLRNGMFLLFSKNSQMKFTHGVPAVVDDNDYSPRISATFRNLK